MQRILIVDDNSFFRKALRSRLLSQFPSLVASEAKDVAETNESGLELTRSIKGIFPDIKVVLLTSYDLPEYQKAAFQYKADHCMSKDSFAFARIPRGLLRGASLWN